MLAAPRTMGTAIGRNIAHQDGKSQNGNTTSIFLDEAITRTFDDAYQQYQQSHHKASPIPKDTTVSRFTHNVVAHYVNKRIKKFNKNVSNITLHEYPASVLSIDNNCEKIDEDYTKEFLSSFDTISLTLRAPHKVITSALKSDFEEKKHLGKKEQHIEFDLAAIPKEDIKIAIKKYTDEIYALLYITNMIDSSRSLLNKSVTAINVDYIDEKTVADLKEHPTPNDGAPATEYIESYGIASPNNPFKKNSLKAEWTGITPHVVSQKSAKDTLSPLLDKDLLTDFRTCQNAYQTLKEKLTLMHRQGKIEYIGAKA